MSSGIIKISVTTYEIEFGPWAIQNYFIRGRDYDTYSVDSYVEITIYNHTMYKLALKRFA